MKRSDFLKFSGLLGGGLLGGLGLSSCAPKSQGNGTPTGSDWSSVTGSMMDHAAPAIPKVRVAMLGLGNRGSSLIEMLEWLVTQGHAEIRVLCDVQAPYVARAAEKVATFQASAPLLLDDASGEAWREACNPEVADLVVIATLHNTRCFAGPQSTCRSGHARQHESSPSWACADDGAREGAH